MKIQVSQANRPVIFEPGRLNPINLRFENLTDKEISPPPSQFSSNAKYYQELEDVFIYGNRSCLDGNRLLIDCPIEWSEEQLYQYVDRVNTTHKFEFNFLSNFNAKDGTAELIEGRPYMAVETPCIFVGCVEAWNFGFFISVLMYKTYLSEKIAPKLPVLAPITKKWQADLLHHIFPTKKFIFYDPHHPIKLKSALLIGWPNFGFFIDKDYLSIYQNPIFDQFTPSGGRKIYFSRRKIKTSANRAQFLAADEANLLKKGYIPIYPEDHTYSNLQALLRNCTNLVLESGSALFNTLFLPPTAKVHLLESRPEFLNHHARFLSSTNPLGEIIFCSQSNISEAIERLD